MHIELTLTEELLGTKASNPDVFADFIASKAPDDDARKQELDTAEHREQAGTTVFHRLPRRRLLEINTKPPPGTLLAALFGDSEMPGYQRWANGDPEALLWGVWDYQIKGFLKEAARAFNGYDEQFRNGLAKLTAFKTKVATMIFVFPRFIVFNLPADGMPGKCERPLRAETAQGPRVTVVGSETMPAGTVLDFEIKCLNEQYYDYVREFLKYGALYGLGAWRNSGKGRFSFLTAT